MTERWPSGGDAVPSRWGRTGSARKPMGSRTDPVRGPFVTRSRARVDSLRSSVRAAR